MRIDLYSLDTWEYERSRITSLGVSLDCNRFIDRYISMCSRIFKRLLFLDRCNDIDKLGHDSELLLQGSLEDVKVRSLHILTEELRRNLYRKSRFNQ